MFINKIKIFIGNYYVRVAINLVNILIGLICLGIIAGFNLSRPWFSYVFGFFVLISGALGVIGIILDRKSK